MSVIIAVKHAGVPYLAFDSRGTTGSSYFTYHKADAKCFMYPESYFQVAFGIVGSHKLSCYIRSLTLPDYTGNVHKWLRKTLAILAENCEFETIFIVIKNDIYKCWSNLSYHIVTDTATLGSGQHLALGAYMALGSFMDLKPRLQKSLAIAAEIDSACGAPFYLLNCATGKYEDL
jgi:hypothetical protein